MRDDAFRAWLGGRIDAGSVSSYMSNARRVERTLRQDLDASDLSDLGLSNMRSALLTAGVPPRPASDCLSALRQYSDFRAGMVRTGSTAQQRRSALDHPRQPRVGATRTGPPPTGVAILAEATSELGIDLVALVARCAVWADPSIVAALMRVDRVAAWVPNCRRARPGEKRGGFVEGVLLDDNTRANGAIKLATFGHRQLQGFHACHVWPESCYDARHHTSIANLVLLPAPLASLTDYDREVSAALRYRAFEIYCWRPEGETDPKQPARYPGPELWRPFPPVTDEVKARVSHRLSRADIDHDLDSRPASFVC